MSLEIKLENICIKYSYINMHTQVLVKANTRALANASDIIEIKYSALEAIFAQYN